MPVSSGRIAKIRRGKNLTPHGKNHRWESLTSKISKLHSLDPLRKVRRHELDAEDLSATTSYFHQGLQRWSQLNLAAGFVSFKRQAVPMSESLAQILHFSPRLMDLLDHHLSTDDKESLEPLLDLLAAFARDLGPRFEKYYGRSLGLLAAVLTRLHHVEVIEWTFTTLAFLFKYLAKLLVPDLHPTYGVLVPLLGRDRSTTPHIARFSAEAMSFLIKKAAAPSHRDASLVNIVNHVRDDLCAMVGERQFGLYRDGVMTMFAEAIKGPGEAIHSNGPALIKALLSAIPDSDRRLGADPVWTPVICGALTSVLHGTNAAALSELVDAIISQAQTDLQEGASSEHQSHWRILPWFQILGMLAGVRGGTRVANWSPITQLVMQMMELPSPSRSGSDSAAPDECACQFWKLVMANLAIIWHKAPMDALIPNISRFNRAVTREPFMALFVQFCSYFDRLDPTRFSSLFRNDFQKFMVNHFSDGKNEALLCILLPKMSLSSEGADKLRLPQGWQDQIVSKFERLEVSPFPERGAYDKDPQTWRDVCLPKYSALLQVLESTAVHPSTNARISHLLLRKLKLALRPSSTLASDEVHFIISQGFKAYLKMVSRPGLDPTLRPLLRAAVPRIGQSVSFLEAFLEYEQSLAREVSPSERHDRSSTESSASDEDPVFGSLRRNLSSASSPLRLVSLKLLRLFHSGEPEVAGALDIMLQTEAEPLTASNARSFGMHLRKLTQICSNSGAKSPVQQAVPHFLFGMLTVKMSPVWEEAAESLKLLVKLKECEETISDLVFAWLEVPSPKWAPSRNPLADRRTPLTAFDCTQLQALNISADELVEVLEHPENTMLKKFDAQQRTADTHVHNARAQALKVLMQVPELAEKKSRRLIPLFLSWAVTEADDGLAGAGDNSDDAGDDDPSSTNWSLTDRKALLGIFCKFSNPKALYQSERMYACMLDLLKNGDTEVQKLAVRTIFTWKQDGIRPYQERLENLLDESKFKDKLVLLLQTDSEGIREEDRKDLMPVLLRLLFGRSIAKRGTAARHSMIANRLSIIRNLSTRDLASFLEVAVGNLKDIRISAALTSTRPAPLFEQPIIPIRNQLGFLNMISSIIRELGAEHTLLLMDILLNAVLYCLIFSCRHLAGANEADAAAEEEEENDDEEEEEDEKKTSSHSSILRSARTAGLKCLVALFKLVPDFDWSPYRQAIQEEVVLPRMEKLPTEMAQGVSTLLQLISTWSTHPNCVPFLAGTSIFPKIVECLAVEKGKEEVKVFVLDMIRNLVNLALDPGTERNEACVSIIRVDLLAPNLDTILLHITTILQTPALGTSLLEQALETMIDLAPLAENSGKAEAVLAIATFLLQQPPRRVSPKAKGRVLLVVERFIAPLKRSQHLSGSSDLSESLYRTLSSLFGYFKDWENREALARVFLVFAEPDPELQEISGLVTSLNTFARGRIGEPDYDTRLVAFAAIVKERDVPLTRRQWLPLLYNLLFSIRIEEEFGVLAANSADCIGRFIADASSGDKSTKPEFEQDLRGILLPAIYAGAKEQSDTVRREYIRVFGRLISQLSSWGAVADLRGLLDRTEEDKSELAFFFHILSPAGSRKQEALKLLEAANSGVEMSSQNLSQFFIPLLEHLVFGRPEEGGDSQGIGAQAVAVIGQLAKSLEWKHYRTMLHRYISYIDSKPASLKSVNRLLGTMVDALAFSSLRRRQPPPTAADLAVTEQQDVRSGDQRLACCLPSEEKLHTDILEYFLPTLLRHVNHKDESAVSSRVPVAVIVAKLLKMVPEEQMSMPLSAILTDICHILRSKAWESREMARGTLAKMASVLGPSFFGFILKELRGALTRGYQLHVLSYTMHAILVTVIPEFTRGGLDYCLAEIVTVIMDDIFGVVGAEKDATEYTSDTREVKVSKSQDSMELIAKNSSIGRLNELVSPLHSLLMQRVDLNMVRKIDALLARITAGLMQSPAAESRDTLVFCYEVIQEHFSRRDGPSSDNRLDPNLRKYLSRRGATAPRQGVETRHTYKVVRFAVEILRSVLKKNDSLRTAANITGLIPIICDLVVTSEDEVRGAIFRLLNVIAKVPISGGDMAGLYKTAAKEAIKGIANAPSVATEFAQSALKLLSVILRDRPGTPVKAAAVDMVLKKMRDELTQPIYRAVTFNFLRSVLGRKIETAVVYDTADYVGTVMITNDDKNTRDLARGAFFQFLREYPQKKSRWEKQLSFIVANLKYDRDGGRISAMEVIHLLLRNSSDEFVQEVAATCFLPLVFVLANDEAEKCRLSAAEVLKELFRKADRERITKFLGLLHTWAGNDENVAVERLAIQALALYLEVRESAAKDAESFRITFDKATKMLDAESVLDTDPDSVLAALSAIRVLTDKFPSKLYSPSCEGIWSDDVSACLRHTDGAVQLAAIRLTGMYLADFAKNANAEAATLAGSHGIELDSGKINRMVHVGLGTLNGAEVDGELAKETAQVLIFLGPRLADGDAAIGGAEYIEGENEDEDEEGVGEEAREVALRERGGDLRYMLWRLSRLLRKEIPARGAAIRGKMAAMEVMETVCRRVSPERLRTSLRSILIPLHQLTDDAVSVPHSTDDTFQAQHEVLRHRAQIMLDGLQKKLGTAEYTRELLAVREFIRDRRTQRSSKRKIEAVTRPEKHGAEKRIKHEKQKQRRKVRGREEREKRQHGGW